MGFPVRASSWGDVNWQPSQGYLNNQIEGPSGGCWYAGASDQNQYFQVSFFEPRQVIEVAIQGRAD
jgi:hypothetical protein